MGPSFVQEFVSVSASASTRADADIRRRVTKKL